MQRSLVLKELIAVLGIVALFSVAATFVILTDISPKQTGLAAGVSTVAVESIVSFSLTASEVNFGNLVQGGSNDTADNAPSPFALRNDGNVLLDINILANSFLFSGTGSGNNTSTFRFKAANASGEANVFSWSGSITDFTNFTDVNQKVIASMNYTNSSDEAEIEIAINVPANEATGAKSADIVFTASQSP